jgi:hypothetical protein
VPQSIRSTHRHGSVWPVVAVLLALIVAGVVVVRWQRQSQLAASERSAEAVRCAQVASAFRTHTSGVWLALSGTVSRLLSDTAGVRVHQRFVVGCPSGQTVLIVNDISIGQRAPVRVGEHVSVRGQYIWNSGGGLIHFTHHATGGAESGWILVGGRLYSLGSAPFS